VPTILRPTTTDDPAFRELAAEQVLEVMRRYSSDDPGPDVHGGLPALVAERMPDPHETLPGGHPAGPGPALLGCVALSPLEPGVAEVKRMFVREGARGQGIARRLLAGIEQVAEESGTGILKLEVGTMQPEAVALYESAGWLRTDCYGYWKDEPLVICMQKSLPGSAARA
jgi:GNAT superfamily N-acetyltransferase